MEDKVEHEVNTTIFCFFKTCLTIYQSISISIPIPTSILELILYTRMALNFCFPRPVPLNPANPTTFNIYGQKGLKGYFNIKLL